MPKENTSRRRRAGGFDNAPAPRQQSELIGRPVPEAVSSAINLQTLQSALQSFFNATVSAAQTAAAGERAVEIAKLRQENDQQKEQGIADALKAGPNDEMSPTLANDLDYANAYTQTSAAKTALDLSLKFKTELAALPVDEDVDAFKEKFLQDALRNGLRYGTGNPIYDATFLATFQKDTTDAVQAHRVAAVKNQLAVGRLSLQSEVASNVMNYEPSDIPALIARSRALNPASPADAPGLVLDSLIAGAGHDQNKISRVVWLLEQPGSGDEGRSFSQQFPAATLAINEKLTQRFQSGVSWEAALEYDKVRLLAEQTTDPGVLGAMIASGGLLDRTRERFGEAGQYDALRKSILTRLQAAQKDITELNQVREMAMGIRQVDVSLVKKRQADYMRLVGLDPFENPEGAADVVTSFRNTLNEDLKAEYASALTNLGAPDSKRFQAALRFYMAIENTSGEHVALDMIPEEARPDYLYAKRQVLYANRAPSDLMVEMRDNRSGLDMQNKVTWKTVIGATSGTTDAEAEKRVQDRLRSKLSDMFGTTVHVAPTVMNDLMGLAKTNYLKRTRTGGDSWKEAVDDVAKSAAFGMKTYPGADGRVMVEPTLVPPEVPATDPYGNLIRDEAGRFKTTELTPFGRNVRNPDTGDYEDTIKVWRDDAKALARAMPTIEGMDSNKLAVDGRSAWAAKGYWLVTLNGAPMQFALGRKYTINGQTIELPRDPRVAEEMVSGLRFIEEPFVRQTMVVPEDLAAEHVRQGAAAEGISVEPGPTRRLDIKRDSIVNDPSKRFFLIPFPEDGRQGFLLAYRPGFATRLPTAEEREQKFGAKRQ